MYSLTIKNKYGDSVMLTQRNDISIEFVDGLNPPESTINLSENALFDGARFNSKKVQVRYIDIGFVFRYFVEKTRIDLYRYIKTGEWIELNYANGTRNVKIDAYVQSFNINYFANPQNATINLVCPQPYFQDANEIIFSINSIVNNFIFPFSIEEQGIPFGYYETVKEFNVFNAGDVKTGMKITMLCNGTVENPRIFNRLTREMIGVNYEFIQGDELIFSTHNGKKTITLIRNATEINLFNYQMDNLTWLQLEADDNVFVYEADNGTDVYLDVYVEYTNLYEGV